jgi:hypothetical protein
VIHHRGTEDTEASSIINDPVNAGAKHLNIEIDKHTHMETGHFEVGEQLCSMHWQNLGTGFDLNNYGLLNNEVQPVAAFDIKVTITDRKRNLTPIINTPEAELSTQAYFVS